MKPLTFYLILLFSLMTTWVSAQQKNNWISLFEGKSTEALRGYQMSSFPAQSWHIEDGALVAQTGAPNIDLVTKENFKNFELNLDWKISKAGNSGVFYYIDEAANKVVDNGNSPNWLDNFEMQLLDDVDFNDKAPIRSAGSLYDLIAPTNKVLKPVGEYNQSRLIVNANHVEHWLNGVKVVDYEIGSPALSQLISKSKYKDNPRFAKSTNGVLMFQHHGQKVWLKNIKVRRLD
ncbi:DUF1080 domain-containing protein [Spirosoma soli]|uniref:DUF1080 domain-containing protein n=1 Tax=Spirosoma soli TaxID=1770529 RepID=A0ABW5MDB8_9BACT